MRLIIIANRLPVSLSIEDKKLQIKDSAGGLATGLTTYLEAFHRDHPGSEHLWVGWPGSTVPDELKPKADKELAKRDLAAVYLTEEEKEAFYYGFCNDTIWPLFHSFPSLVDFSQESWEAYKVVNQRFADQIAAIIKPGDVVWVHDYQLMLLPRMLRERISTDTPIGFFLHTPFPTFEIYRLLPHPWRRALLSGVLGSDLTGFHTYDYAQYFAGCVERILGYERSAESLLLPARTVGAYTYPIGIDFDKFYKGAATKEVAKAKRALSKAIGDRKLVLSIDRLDYSKGIDKRLLAYEQFFIEHPEYEDKVTLALVVIPSREEVQKYADMKREIDEIVGRINGRFGTMDWTPIHYQYTSLPFEELSALYSRSDVALVTPLRDGMNMIAKEYVASRRDQSGVLVLSEMAGAAHELGEAIIINPNHTEEIASALYEALEMPLEEQQQNNKLMQDRLRQYDIVRWGNDFVEDLLAHKAHESSVHKSAPLSATDTKKIVKDFSKAKQRLILLDYDGTLVPFEKFPLKARPSKALLETLTKLAELPNTTLAILSGRSHDVLESWLAKTGAILSAEHGALLYRDNEWHAPKPLSTEWKDAVLPVLHMYVDRVPGTFLEEKEYSAVWHFRMAHPDMVIKRKKELVSTLRSVIAGMSAQVLTGSKIIEVRCLGVDKGSMAMHLLEEGEYDFVMALGDDTTDEDMFRALPDSAYTIKVRPGQTAARYVIDEPAHSQALLESFLKPPKR